MCTCLLSPSLEWPDRLLSEGPTLCVRGRPREPCSLRRRGSVDLLAGRACSLLSQSSLALHSLSSLVDCALLNHFLQCSEAGPSRPRCYAWWDRGEERGAVLGTRLWAAHSQAGLGFEPAFWLLLLLSHPVVSDSFSAPWIEDFPGKNTGVGCHFLSPGELPDPGIEPASPACVSCIAGGLWVLSHWKAPLFGSILFYFSQRLCWDCIHSFYLLYGPDSFLLLIVF